MMIMTTYETRKGEAIDLSGLSSGQTAFWADVQRLAESGAAWTDFQNFCFGPNSPIFYDAKGERLTNLQATRSPLYLACRDMAAKLGIEQGHLRQGDGKPDRTKDIEQFKVSERKVGWLERIYRWARR